MIYNEHTRILNTDPRRVGSLLDALGSPEDRLWPRGWPKMRFNGPLAVGTQGGHGPIRYTIEHYQPGHEIRFRITRPAGFIGTHAFTVEPLEDGRTRLKHVIDMTTTPAGWLLWHLAIRPLHDTVVEEAFDRASAELGSPRKTQPRPFYVRLLRLGMSWLKKLRAAAGARRRGYS